MKPRQLFPLGKAYGPAFCNRVEETQKLVSHIENGKHTFLVAPRRYGKSSLCEHVFEEINFAWSKVDFHLAVLEKDAERLLINGIMDLISKSIGSVEKLVHIIKKYAKKLQPKFVLGNEHFKLELTHVGNSSVSENIAEALQILDKLLVERDKKAVLLLDEFQEVGNIVSGRGIEGAIRHVAQETKNLAIIFCGSNPHLLNTMFEDERRPLYKLCRKIVLDRIDETAYYKHLNNAAKKIWGKKLSDDSFTQIMMLTERHPYYVNYLCDVLCSDSEILPSLTDIKKAWNVVIEEERSDLIKDFSALSQNQRKLMIHIANYGGDDLYSVATSQKTDIPVSSISRALSTLIEKDYLEKVNDSYRLIVPVFKQILHEPK